MFLMETPSPIQNFYIMKSVMLIDEKYEKIVYFFQRTILKYALMHESKCWKNVLKTKIVSIQLNIFALKRNDA